MLLATSVAVPRFGDSGFCCRTTPYIDFTDILSLEIPLPSPEVQEQIAEEALRLRSEATKLRQEADSIVEAAKEEIVGILLAEG